MLRATKTCEFCFEPRHFGTVDELAMPEHTGNRLVDGFAEPSTLGGQIDERNGFETQVLVHGALQELRTRHQRALGWDVSML